MTMTDNSLSNMRAELGLPSRIEIMGAPIDPWTMGQTVQATEWFIRNRRFAHLIGVNADKLLQMQDDSRMDEIVRRCEIVNADGASMVMASKKLGVSIPERVAGIDLMWYLCSLAERDGNRVFLLGAKDAVVKQTAEVLTKRHPKLVIAGLRDGYFDEAEFDAVVREVQDARPHIVFVGITSPKKEQLIERFRKLGSRAVFVGVGGSFDVISGNIPRAPMWMQRMNLEWLFRMVNEPKRLFKRYLVGNTRFFLLLRKEIRKGTANG